MKTLLASTLPLVFLAACAHNHATSAKDPSSLSSPNARDADAQANAAAPGGGSTCASDSACGEGQICLDGACVNVADHLSACVGQHVRFDFDSSLLPEAERPLLDRAARCLKADHAVHLTIEGAADERGTEEYNMALGDRRATAVAKFLDSLGVSQAQLRTVSYGAEHPLCDEHNEQCWSQNRRADLKIAQGPASPKKHAHH